MISEARSESEVGAFIARFEGCALTRAEWTHEAHLVAGFWYVRRFGEEAALEVMRVRIREHNEAVGTPNTDDSGYHETLTRLYLRAIADHLRVTPGSSFENGLAALLASPIADRGWPLLLYARDRLFSVEARRTWIEPDVPGLIGSSP